MKVLPADGIANEQMQEPDVLRQLGSGWRRLRLQLKEAHARIRLEM